MPPSRAAESPAELMDRRYPPVHHSRFFRTESICGQADSRRHGRDPVQTIEHCEERETIEGHERKRQINQRKTAQPIMPGLMHRGRCQHADADRRESSQRGSAQAEALHQRRSEWTAQAVEKYVDANGQ
jgi:hypothetical protein